MDGPKYDILQVLLPTPLNGLSMTKVVFLLHRASHACQSHPPPSPFPAGCQSDNECPLTEACYNRECQDPCRYLNCGANAECSVNAHNAICTCLDRYRGNPYHECRRYECLVDQDCPNHLKCDSQKCVDPCACAANAECKARDHRGICNCIPDHFGDPYVEGCRPPVEPIVEEFECETDGDCPSKEACFFNDGGCANPCLRIRPCQEHAECSVKDELPKRVMICKCKPGYIERGDRSCQLIPEPVEVGCRGDGDCPPQLACRNRGCVDPCAGDTCAATALCTVQGHRAVCSCPPGTTGDPHAFCSPVQVGCRSDSECGDDEACVDGDCKDPCAFPNDPCGRGAICRAHHHIGVCRCPEGWAGNPHTECYTYECLTDAECPLDKACVSKECRDPCAQQQCGLRADCEVDYHVAKCACRPGLQGNPFVECVEVGCRIHDDCADNEQCDKRKQQCVRLCADRNTCVRCGGFTHQFDVLEISIRFCFEAALVL